MSQTPLEFYTKQVEMHSKELQQLKKKIAFSSGLRLLVFILICVSVYVAFGSAKAIVAVLLVGISLFVYLVSKHGALQYQRDLKKKLISQNKTEIGVLAGTFMHLPDGSIFKSNSHAYSQDIDLFGRGSFFQYLNRTALSSGAQQLANILTENSIDTISEKQEAIKELSGKAIWRQHFAAVAALVKTEVSVEIVTSWLDKYTPFAPSWIKKGYYVFTTISVLLLAGYFLDIVSGYVPFGWFLVGLALSGRYVLKVNKLSQQTAKTQNTFEQFHKLISEIENITFTSKLLSEKKGLVFSSEIKASTILRKFAKHLDALDQRNNVLVGVFLNGFMLRDLYIAHTIEQWIETHANSVAIWYNTITFFDAYNSLGNYAFNHPCHAFPIITEEPTVLKVNGGGHPLLHAANMVRNNFEINQKEFFIVTGANMAGKSTFLRTVSLQIVMANVGLPTCADVIHYNPIKLITSMRTSDSLTDDESYFFSELKRLKYIVECIQKDRYFIILDEILKGTNSKDKAIGSRKFVEKLVAGNATGIIATHDLSLCEIAREQPAVKNYYFDAQIKNNELYFDYTFQSGICQNMNASFLLKKMNIVE